MGERRKKISVIIPCYNVAPYIDRCLSSVKDQTIGMDSLEIICIDDASTDDTWLRLQKWEQRFPEDVLLIRQEKNQKPGAARNIGLMYASAEWVAFVDADDWLDTDYFEMLYNPMQKYECEVVVCSFIRDICDPENTSEIKPRKQGKYIVADTKDRKKKLFLDGSLGFGPWAKLIRKSLLMNHEIFFPEGLSYEDIYWLPLLYAYVEKAYVFDECAYHYFLNPDSTTLCNNADHHMDILSIQLRKWTDYSERGLLSEYQEELEKDALNDAVCTMTQFVVLYDEPSFSFYRMEREFLKRRIPEFRYKYYRPNLDPTSRLLLDILYSSLDESAFLQIMEQVKAKLIREGKGNSV